MTAELLTRLAACEKRIKQLRDANNRMWISRREWRRKHTACMYELSYLRRNLENARAQRDRWKAAAKPRPAEWKNIHLSAADLERIMGMKPR